jgi:putative aldouronate transport system substrate-binding protein
MSKKGWSVLLAALLVLSLTLAACSGGKKESQSNGTGGSQPPASSGDQASEKPKEPVKITIMLPLNVSETPTDTIKKELEKLTNTELTYQWQPADTYDDKLTAAFAAGTLPEVTYLKNQASFNNFKEAIRDGQFWEIGPYLKEFPNLSKLKEQILNNTKVDGKIYTLYVGRPLARQGIIYRKDWADKLGLSAPKNTDELFEMLKRFTEDDPDGNGIKDTIGLADRNDLIYGAFKTLSSYFGTPNNWGEKDGQLLPEFMFPGYIATMDYMKKIRDNGYMNVDFAATSKTDQVSLFTSGKAGVYIGSMQDVNSLYNDLVKNVPTAEVDTHSQIAGPDGNYATWAIPGYNNLILFPKSAIKDEARLKEILAFFDKMMTPEVSNLMYWGIEGVHYTVIDGKAKEVDDKDLVTREVKGYKDSVIGEPETAGYYEPYLTLPARVKADTELLPWNEQHAVHDPTAALDSPTFAEKGAELTQIITDATYQYIYGQIDQAGFEKAIETWKKRGGQQVIDEFNASWQASK